MPKLLLDTYGIGPQEVGFCFKTGRTRQFIVHPGKADDYFLAIVGKSPTIESPYGASRLARD